MIFYFLFDFLLIILMLQLQCHVNFDKIDFCLYKDDFDNNNDKIMKSLCKNQAFIHIPRVTLLVENV